MKFTLIHMICTVVFVPVASSKQRSKLRSSLSSEKTKLGVTVVKYNSLSSIVEEVTPTSVDEVINGKFPWSLLAGTYVCTYVYANTYV